jgi:FecR protein
MVERILFKRAVNTLLLAAALVVCLSPAYAQSTSRATAIQLVGNVAVIKDTSMYRTALFNGNQVSPGQLIVTGPDGYAKFQIADGSTFEVFPDSQVTFRSTMSMGDLLNVMIGKIKVWIQHAPGIPNPNNVTTPSALISVRGTIFIVYVRDSEGTTDVAVDEGIVDVRHLLRGGPTVRLIQGQATTVDPRNPLVGLGGNRGAILQRGLRAATDMIRDVMLQRNSGGPSAAPGTGGGSSGGAQGDNGKPTDTGTGNTGKGSPTGGSGTGSPTGGSGTPPPPPPGGGGG